MVANSEVLNPNEHLQIPQWITASYFDKILQQDEPNCVKIKKFTPTAAIPPGENFTSIMLRVHLELEMQNDVHKHKTYVFKTMLDEDKGGSVVRELSLFPKELDMYHKFIPAFEELYKAAGKNVQLAPKCLLSEQKKGYINFVFEDLTVRKFENVDRMKGFDMPHMKRVLQKLAEYHAASVVYAEQNGPYPEVFESGFISKDENIDFQKNAYFSKMAAYKEAMSQWGLRDAKKYIEKFPTYEQFWKCGRRTLDTSSNLFNVLTHGDFWSSNVMQNYLPDGSIDEVLLVDFQFCKWGAPAEDLFFLITISAAKDIRIKEWDLFIQIYHKHLVKCLRLLNYKKPMPKLRDLQMDMYRENSAFYAFFAVFNHLLVLLLPSDKDSGIDNLMRDDEIGRQYRERAFANPLFMDAMRDLYPFFHRRGVFNFEDYD